jgi:hypothetical protein
MKPRDARNPFSQRCKFNLKTPPPPLPAIGNVNAVLLRLLLNSQRDYDHDHYHDRDADACNTTRTDDNVVCARAWRRLARASPKFNISGPLPGDAWSLK